MHKVLVVSEVAESRDTQRGVRTQLVQELVAQLRQLGVGVVNCGKGCGLALGVFHQHQNGMETSPW